MKTSAFRLTCFSRKTGRYFSFFALGLGGFSFEVKVRSQAHAPRELQQAFSQRLAGASAHQLALCRRAPEVRLVKAYLDIRFQQPESFHLAGRAPLVLETLPQALGDSREIAYSPLRPRDFFVVDPALDLGRQASVFFAEAWQGLTATEALRLLCQGQERLQQVAVKLSWRALYEEAPQKAEKVGAGRRREPVLDHLAEDIESHLTGRREKLEALPRRLDSLERRLLPLLASAQPPSLAFVGPAGCGKSTQIEKLAARLLVEGGFLDHGSTAGLLKIFRLSGRRLISGMSYLGEWEQRCLDLIEECRQRRRFGMRRAREEGFSRGERPPIVLWVDDLGAWGQIGRSRDSSRCLADVFVTALRRGELLIFGEATPESFALLEDEAPAFAALFQRVELTRPDAGAVLTLLLEASRELEDRHDSFFHPSSLRSLIELAPALFGENAHPAHSCALLQMAAEVQPQGEPVRAGDINRLLSRESGLPQELLSSARPLTPEALREFFSQRVIGQEEAIEVVCELLLTLKAGLQDPRRPYAVLLFTGPTGTGKTELAKTLAAWLYGDERRLLRFDMGEHADPGAVTRLVGDRGRPQGELTEAIRAQPFAVLLFDEIEKADRGVLQLLLQVFEDGRLTDALGQLADFRQAVLILTSNLGARSSTAIGLRQDAAAQVAEARQAVERFFAPELFNRIDRVVAFRPLAAGAARGIAEIELYRIFGRRGLAERGIFVRADPGVVERIVELGFDGKSGARGVQRFLEREIVVALTEALAAADPAAFLLLHLGAPSAGGFTVAVEAIHEAAALAANPAIDRLYELTPARLLEEIPAWLARLEALHQERQQALENEQRQHLQAFLRREGSLPGAADALHEVDLLRGRLLELRERLAAELERRQPDEGELREMALSRLLQRPSVARRGFDGGRPPRRSETRAGAWAYRPIAGEEMVALASEILWLEYAAAGAGEQRSVSGEVALDLLSEHRPGKKARAENPVPSLQQELAALLMGDGLLLESFRSEEPAGSGRSRAELEALLERRPRRLWLEVSGTLLAERLRGDIGSYVRVRQDGNQEIVRLDFRLAGEKNASGNLPLRQLIHFEPGPEGEPRPCQVEDFGLCLEVKRPVRELGELLRPLRRRRQMALLAAPPGGAGHEG